MEHPLFRIPDSMPIPEHRPIFEVKINTVHSTAKSTVISPNFPVWKLCGKAQCPHSFG